MVRLNLVVGLCVALLGCASVGDELHDELRQYIGKNVQTIIARIGYPTSQQKVLGDIVYTWSTNPGRVDFDWGAVNLYCNIQIATDDSGQIKSGHYAGNNGGCQRWADALAH